MRGKIKCGDVFFALCTMIRVEVWDTRWICSLGYQSETRHDTMLPSLRTQAESTQKTECCGAHRAEQWGPLPLSTQQGAQTQASPGSVCRPPSEGVQLTDAAAGAQRQGKCFAKARQTVVAA